MFVKQLSIFVENTFGSASDIVELLSAAKINMSALSIADTSDYGIMRLIVDDPEKAKSTLQENGIIVKLTNVLAIPIGHKPGELANVLKILKDGRITIEYMYAFVGNKPNSAVVITRTDDLEITDKVLRSYGIETLSEKDLF